MKITSKGQVTIPIEFREKLGLVPDSEVEFELVGNTLQIKKVKKSIRKRSKKLLDMMKGKATVSMTTDEIMEQTRK